MRPVGRKPAVSTDGAFEIRSLAVPAQCNTSRNKLNFFLKGLCSESLVSWCETRPCHLPFTSCPAPASLWRDVRLCKDTVCCCLPRFLHKCHTPRFFAISPVSQDFPTVVAVICSAALWDSEVQITLGCWLSWLVGALDTVPHSCVVQGWCSASSKQLLHAAAFLILFSWCYSQCCFLGKGIVGGVWAQAARSRWSSRYLVRVAGGAGLGTQPVPPLRHRVLPATAAPRAAAPLPRGQTGPGVSPARGRGSAVGLVLLGMADAPAASLLGTELPEATLFGHVAAEPHAGLRSDLSPGRARLWLPGDPREPLGSVTCCPCPSPVL